MLCTFILTLLLFKASVSEITMHGERTADYGRSVLYSCAVDDSTGVLQITWQRLVKDSMENLATFSKRFGKQVNEPYSGKVVFTEASLNSTSITVKNVTWEDSGCYICSFNVYPAGSQRKQICLTVQGISEIKTKVHPTSTEHVVEEDDEEVVVVTCSATGKPAPTIQWAVPADATQLDTPKPASVQNRDRTFTSSSNITLQVSSDWNGYVDCLLNKDLKGQRQERIIVGDGKVPTNEETVKQLSKSGIALVVSSTLFVAFIIFAVALKRKRLKSNRRNLNV
ncbi:OX-2 membrane glycoprotein isoform X1 [Xyrichtys novacula]|uniref:OX-2 membrane glycoprotein isoform X1 n=1 Tax=Xyrichtys novacula TaxID=13765 RepID=A0AAV1HRA3_XYRNO|nr:OX-2 membrane glycoprotein isoform X1 [Xyrichtys novacula]